MAPMWYVLSGDSLQVSVGGNHLVLHAPFILPRQHVNLMTRRCVQHSTHLGIGIISPHNVLSLLCSYAGHALFNSPPKKTPNNQKHQRV